MGAEISAEKKRVLVVTRWAGGGIGTWLRSVYGHPLFREFELCVVAPDFSSTAIVKKELSRYGVEVIPTPDAPLRFFRSIFAVARRFRPHLVHSHGFIAATSVSPIAKVLRVPHMTTQHDMVLEEQFQGFRGRAARGGVELGLRGAGLVHAVSHAAKENLISQFSFLARDPGRVLPILNGVDAKTLADAIPRNLRAEMDLADSDYLIGFVGRFMGPKGFRFLVSAVQAMVANGNPERRPVVIAMGDGGYRAREERAIAALGLSDHFRFVGFVEDVGAYIKGVDVVAMPSLWESCGLVAMEALVAGTPLVCSDCPALREVAQNSPARIVRAGDAQSLANALLFELANGTKAEAQAFVPRAIRRFDIQGLAERICALYQKNFDRSVSCVDRSPAS